MEPEINEWTRKSKRYKTRYMDELGKLYKECTDAETITDDPLRGSRTDPIGHLVDQMRD